MTDTNPTDNKHLLLIDDDQSIHRVFTLVTALSNYRISSILSPEEALAYAANPNLFDKPDVMVVDYMLGGTPGTDVIK